MHSQDTAGPVTWRVSEEGRVALVRFGERNLNDHFAERHREGLKLRLAELADDGASVLLLDLGAVEALDSCGVGLILSAFTVAAAQGVEIGIVGVAPHLERVFEVMRLRPHLRIFPSEVEAAVALLGPR